MSLNHSKPEKNELQYRKASGGGRSGGSGQQRSFIPGRSRGGGGSTAPPLSDPSLSTCRSYKKTRNAQGVQSRLNTGSANAPETKTAPAAQNGSHAQPTLHAAVATSKSNDTSSQGSSRSIPRAPSSQSPAMKSDSTTPTFPTRGDGDKGFALQFGSINPGLMNGVPVPPRTTSAPPNLDEQNHDQACHDASGSVSAVPVPSAPKPEITKKVVAPISQHSNRDVHAVKRDTAATSAYSVSQAQKPPVPPMGAISISMSYPQPPVSLQFCGPNPQMQSQGLRAASILLPMQMPLQTGNQQPMFLPHHLMQAQGMMHPNQGMGFNRQMGQLPHQLGGLGNIGPQFSQQKPAKFGSARKAVKITHPETHEELRLEKKSDVYIDGTAPKPHNNVPSYASKHPVGYYSNSYVGGPTFFGSTSSLPFTNAQLTPVSQASRFNFPVSQAPHALTFMNQAASNLSPLYKGGNAAHGTAESSNFDSAREVQHAVSSASPSVTVKAGTIPPDKVINLKPIEKGELPKISLMIAPMSSSHLKEDSQEKPAVKEHAKLSHQVVAQPSAGLQPQVVDAVSSPKSTSSEAVEPRKELGLARAGKVAAEAYENHTCRSDVANCMGTSVDRCAGQDSPHGEASEAKNDDKSKENLDTRGNNLVTGTVNVSSCGMQSTTSSHVVGGEMSLETSSSDKHLSAVSDDGNTAALERHDSRSGNDAVTKSYSSGVENETITVSVKVSAPEGQGMENARPTSCSGSVSSSSKTSSDLNKTKCTLARGKKKIKQILQKADAEGTISDMYMAYKVPEENKECITDTAYIENTFSNYLKLACTEFSHEGASTMDKDDQSKAEPEDWEDAVDLSTPKMETARKRLGEIIMHNVDDAGTAKKYSRDFLLTFSEQCTNLPDGFDKSDISDILIRPNSSSTLVVDHQYSSPGRIVDRPSSAPRSDRRGGGMMDADRWHKVQSQFPSPQNVGLGPAYGHMSMGFHPGQSGNYGVLRNPRAQPYVQYPILSVPIQSMQRNDNDRWQNANFRGLMPQTPMQAMHKAENKYEVGKVTDEEQAKQRKLKGILNKLTPQNFDKLFAQVKEVFIDNVVTLNGVISQIFDKALTEPTFCEMYSNFCYELSLVLPELTEDDEKITFKRLLLNKCQEEFERGEREEEEANKADTGNEAKLSAEEREQIRVKVRRRMLGNIRLIGELYKRRMLTERIMHECIKKLLVQYPNTAEEDIESLCKLMSTIGEMIDHPKGKEHMDAYFDMMENLSNNMKLSSRVRFMLRDAIDLRKNKWQQRRKVEGPKKIDEVHRDAAQERQQAQATRLSRGPNMVSSMRRGKQTMEFVPRGSSIQSSAGGQMANFRGSPSQGCNYGMHDVRVEEKHSFDNRTITVPLPLRSPGDDSITLGPQGSLARGMSIRGQLSVSSTTLADGTLSHGDTRRTGGLIGFSSVSERAAPNSRDDYSPRYTTAPNSVNRDHKNIGRGMARSVPASAPGRVEETSSAQNMSSERLREKSATTIKEFYSAKDEKEVDLCVRELNAPSFYPSVISIWVTDSFERKEVEREVLNKLIVNLSKPQDGHLFMPDQLIKGFESVLANLEDTVTDAPKAPDFLGRLFTRLILENILSLKEICGLLYNGGEEAGRLREIGLAGDVLGSIVEKIKSEKGEAAFKEMCSSCNLRLQDFRPPDPFRSWKLEPFI